MPLTPQQLADFQRLRQSYAPVLEAQRRKQQAQGNLEKMHGLPPVKPQPKAKGGSQHEIKATVKLGDRDLPITIDPWDKRAGRQIVHVNPKAFDKAFSKSSWQYVGPKGEGGIEGRYQKFADFAKDAPSVHASNADVNKEGGITFGDGRHRYAYLRDQGVQSIPMSMDKQSIQHARRHGYLHEAKGGSINKAKFLKDSKVKDVLYRGGIGHKELAPDFLEGKPRAGYATFASTSPHVAGSYAHTDEGESEHAGGIAPMHIKAHTLHEFPVTVDKHGSRNFDKFAFDRFARRLEPGHAVVARQVIDYGPRASTKTDPERRYSYPSDIYAWNKGTKTKSALSKAKGGRVTHAHHLEIEERPL